MRILIIGRNDALYESAKLLSKKYKICGIVTAAAPSEYLRNEKDFLKLSKTLKCPYLFKDKASQNILDFIRDCKPDIGISVNWISVLTKEHIDSIPLGILNSHPSLLPTYRGNAATSWALVKGEKYSGLTIHKMAPGALDSGDILEQEKYQIKKDTTINDLNQFWCDRTPFLFLNAINKIKKNKMAGRKQSKNSFRAYPRLPVDGRIDWTKSAKEIDLLIRASGEPYAGAYSYLKIKDEVKKVIVWESEVISTKTKDVGTPGHVIHNVKTTGESHVMTGSGVLSLLKVEYQGGKKFSPGKEWKSIRLRFGIDVEEELILIQKMFRRK